MLDFNTYAMLWRAKSERTDCTVSGNSGASVSTRLCCRGRLSADADDLAVLRIPQARMGNHYWYSFESAGAAVLLLATFRPHRHRAGKAEVNCTLLGLLHPRAKLQVGDDTVIRVIPEEAITFPAAENFRANIMKLTEENSCKVVLDCRNLKRIDVTVAKASTYCLLLLFQALLNAIS